MNSAGRRFRADQGILSFTVYQSFPSQDADIYRAQCGPVVCGPQGVSKQLDLEREIGFGSAMASPPDT